MSWEKCTKILVSSIVFLSLILTPSSLFMGLYISNNYSTKGALIVGEYGFDTINEALKHASDGDEIIVRAGVYREQVVINKSLKLFGEGFEKTVIETDALMDAVLIIANNVSVQGFTIRNCGGTAYSSGIRLVNASDCKIENNLVEGKFIGIRLENGSCGNIIRNNILKGNQYGIFLMRRSSGNIIFNNSILANGWNGIELAWYSNNNVFEANTIANNGGYGVEIPIYSPSYDNIFFHNNFLSNSLSNPPGGHVSDLHNNSWWFNGEGNFWDDYTFVDYNKDGIGDSWYCVNGEKATYDKFPLMGKFRCFELIDKEIISIISSSEILILNASIFNGQANIHIYILENRPSGFLRLGVSRDIMRDLSCSLTDNVIYLNYWSTSTYNYVYLEYPSGEISIQVRGITEIPEFTILPIILLAAMLTLFFCVL